jgi:hypothetical protein
MGIATRSHFADTRPDKVLHNGAMSARTRHVCSWLGLATSLVLVACQTEGAPAAPPSGPSVAAPAPPAGVPPVPPVATPVATPEMPPVLPPEVPPAAPAPPGTEPPAQVPCRPTLGALEVLMVVGDADNLHETDDALADFVFDRLNMFVNVADDADDPEKLFPRFDLAVISSSVDPVTIAGKYAMAKRPVLVMHAGVFRAMGMVGLQPEASGTSSGTDIFITPAGTQGGFPVPITLGFLGTLEVARVKIPLNFGVPAPGADVLATLDDNPDRAAIFTYLPGDAMSVMVAPHTRVGFFSDQHGRLTADGQLLFGRAIQWAAKAVVFPPDSCRSAF